MVNDRRCWSQNGGLSNNFNYLYCSHVFKATKFYHGFGSKFLTVITFESMFSIIFEWKEGCFSPYSSTPTIRNRDNLLCRRPPIPATGCLSQTPLNLTALHLSTACYQLAESAIHQDLSPAITSWTQEVYTLIDISIHNKPVLINKNPKNVRCHLWLTANRQSPHHQHLQDQCRWEITLLKL